MATCVTRSSSSCSNASIADASPTVAFLSRPSTTWGGRFEKCARKSSKVPSTRCRRMSRSVYAHGRICDGSARMPQVHEDEALRLNGHAASGAARGSRRLTCSAHQAEPEGKRIAEEGRAFLLGRRDDFPHGKELVFGRFHAREPFEDFAANSIADVPRPVARAA